MQQTSVWNWITSYLVPAVTAWTLGFTGLSLQANCTPKSLTMTGSSGLDGDNGNIREFSTEGLAVKVSAWSRDSGGTWQTAFLGAYSLGLGVTDRGEGDGSGDRHVVDNDGRLNYVLFEFSKPVVVDSAYLGYVLADSDLSVWIGTANDPYANHQTLSDAFLSGMAMTEENRTTSGDPRTADLNSGSVSGNILVIAARTTDTNDGFKIKTLNVCVPVVQTYDYGDLAITGTTFNTTGGGTAANAPRHLVTGSLVLGSSRDSESNGQPGTDATGDDTAGSPDDEDGVSFGTMIAGQVGTVTVEVTGTGGKLNAWVDWNNNGTFESGEKIANNAAVVDGSNVLTVSVPSGAVTGTALAARFRLSTAGNDAAASGTAADGEIEDHTVTVNAGGGCLPETFTLDGSGGAGTVGNIRLFTAGTVSVKASAFSRDSSGTWAGARLGQYTGGLGVTDTGEDGSGNSHTVDNLDRVNYVLFEFSTMVTVDKVRLGYVVDDSDISVWIGSTSDPFNNHITLSDAILSGFGTVEENTTTSVDARLADINSAGKSGNVLVIAALASDTTPEDEFKISQLELCVPSGPAYDYGDLPITSTSFNTTGNGTPANAPRHQISGTLLLGSARDAESNGQPGATATGDDTTGTDDEDGVSFGSLSPGQNGTITVTVAGTGGKLNAWIDWDDDKAFEAGEQIADDLPLPVGPTGLIVNVPLNAVAGSPLAARFRISSAGGDVAAAGSASDGEIEDYLVTLTTSADCVDGTFVFSGNEPADGTDGNVRTFTAGGVSVKVTAFSRTTGTSGTWETAYLGLFGGGLGVTDTSEDGGGNSHTVDNIGRINYVLFEFSQPVVIDRAYLGYVSQDSDLNAWIGTFNDPYNNHLTLSDTQLGAFAFTEANTTTSSSARWADLNAGSLSGNALVISAWTGDADPEDQFKIEKVEFCVPALASIGNYVWVDTNENGMQDESGTGVDGVWVHLYRIGGTLVDSMTTSGGGFYLFSDLPPGDYYVVVDEPLGYTFTSQNQNDGNPNPDARDSDVNTAGIMATTTLVAGEQDLTWDAGLIARLRDLGDLPDSGPGTATGDYETLIGSNGPSHFLGSGLILGEDVDAEVDGQPDAAAAGDDFDDGGGRPDDEDGVTSAGDDVFPASAKQGQLVPFVVQASAAGAKVNAFFDWNGDGDFADAGEALPTFTTTVVGDNAFPVTIPNSATLGSIGVRFRISSAGDLTAYGAAADGEVEDYLIEITPEITPDPLTDWGDLPDNIAGTAAGDYQTVAADQGPSHTLLATPNNGLHMGPAVDGEINGQPNGGATGDDEAGSTPDDEDGVTIPALTRGQTAIVVVNVVNAPSGARLNAFFDWTNDGDFNDAGEVISELSVINGNNNLSVPVPDNAVTSVSLGARFRLSSAGGLGSTGSAPDGEVEDYLVTVSGTPTAVTLNQLRAAVSPEGEVIVSWSTLVEIRTLAFRVERRVGDGAWQRLEGIVPALGSDLRPHNYRLTDAPPALVALRYRLIEIESSGSERVLGEVALRQPVQTQVVTGAGEVGMVLTGAPGGSVLIETATDVQGVWTTVSVVDLDAKGSGSWSFKADAAEAVRFYRAWEQ